MLPFASYVILAPAKLVRRLLSYTAFALSAVGKPMRVYESVMPERLTTHHPEPERVQAVPNKFGLSSFRVEPGEARLEAVINTPSGTRILV
jgi:hypothetical protein